MKFLKKFFERQTQTPNEDRTFVPLGSGGASYGSIFSPQVARCLALYVDFLINCPLKAKNDKDPLYKLLTQRPCPFMSRANFYRLCIQNFFLFDGFFAIIKANDRGEIEALLPYASPQAVQVYPTNFKKRERGDVAGDWGDPEKLYRDGFYFRDYRSRRYTLDQMFYIRSAAFNTGTGLVEQEDFAQRVFNNTYEAASKLEAVINSLCSRDLRPPLLLTGLGYNETASGDIKASASETKKVKEALRTYFENDSQGTKGILALPSGYKIEKMAFDAGANALLAINEVVTSNICNLFNVPRSLVFSGATERDTKEARRVFISGGLKSFCTILQDEFNRLSGYENTFSFDLDELRYSMADIREQSAIAQLQDVLSPEEIKEKINLT